MLPFEKPFALFAVVAAFFSTQINAQQITGTWQGNINKKKVEVKIIQNGDSLTGTSYYYETANNYRRYSIKGYFDKNTNSAVWWDDQLLEETVKKPADRETILSVADFNCPGGGEMFLDGNASPKNNPEEITGRVDLTKRTNPIFNDEWDFVIDNYMVGANQPYIIDSVSFIAFQPVTIDAQPAVVLNEPVIEPPQKRKEMVVIPQRPEAETVAPRLITIEEKFTERKKIITTEIPITADSIELRFYDNAEIDGDSISLFLNNKLLLQHVRLTDKAFTIKLAATELNDSNELTMVAENLGAIPPNTSYMVALVGDKRYEAVLASTENSSAVIVLSKR